MTFEIVTIKTKSTKSTKGFAIRRIRKFLFLTIHDYAQRNEVSKFETNLLKIIDYCLISDLKTAKFILAYVVKFHLQKTEELEISAFTELENIIHDLEVK